ncbi:MAG TPA: flagellar biosynthetic protein FliR [Burkholderiales bacterium]|nr:flagellar biosynthetic protein FliR [Burkholderiales bacterium]
MLSVTSAQLEAWLAAGIWPFLRILALFASAPLLSHRSVPHRVKIGLAVALTLIVAPGLPPAPAGADPAWLLAQQLAIGLGVGLAMQLIFAAFEVAGDLLGLQMGLSFAAFIDPQHSEQTPIVGSFLGLLAMLVFLAINGHLLMIAGIVESFHSLPPGAAAPSVADWKGLALLGGEMFRIGLHISLPVMATMLVLNLALGVLARAAPQLNLMAVGFPATILIGLLALTLTMPLLAPFLESALGRGLAAAFSFAR